MLRWVVAQREEAGHWKVEAPSLWIESILEVLSTTAASHGRAVAVSHAFSPTSPSEATYFIEELKQTIAGLLDVSKSFSTDDPEVRAGHLVDLALQGEIGWVGPRPCSTTSRRRRAPSRGG